MRIKVGYGRVSTTEQAVNTNAAKQQIQRLESAGCEKIYFDVQSGTKSDRAEFLKMMAEVERGAIAAVVITRDDRIARDGYTTLYILETFPRCGVELEVLDAGKVVDLSNPYEWLQRSQAGLNAEFESRMLSLRIKKGFDYLRKEAKANPKPPYGYLRRNEKYQINRDINPRLQVEAFLKCGTLQSACRMIDELYGKRWSHGGLRRWLLNPVLRGHTGYDRPSEVWRNIAYNTHPDQAIMTESEYQYICDTFQNNKRYWGKNRTAKQYPLGGLMFCGECGTKMTVAHGGNNRVYAYCRRRKQWVSSETCGQKKTPRMELVEESVITVLTQRAIAITAIAQTPPNPTVNPELQQLEDKLARLESMGDDPDIEELKGKLKLRIEGMKYGEVSRSEEIGDKAKLLQAFSDPVLWRSFPDTEKRSVYRALVDRIMIKDGAVVEILLKI